VIYRLMMLITAISKSNRELTPPPINAYVQQHVRDQVHHGLLSRTPS